MKVKFKITSFFKKNKTIFYEGMRKYCYYKKIWKTQLDDFAIEHTEKEVRQIAMQDFIKARGKAVLLIILYIIVISFVIISLIRPMVFLIGQIENAISYINIHFRDISSDAWLGFWGSVFGSVVTMLGIIITIKFERKKDDIARKQHAQPILMLQHRKRNDEQNQSDYKSSYHISFCSYNGDVLKYDIIQLQIPDIILRNVGFNAAINIDMMFYIEGMKGAGCSGLDYLPSNEYEAIKIVVKFYKQEIKKIFKDIQYKKKDNFNAYFANAYSNLNTEFHDKIEFVAKNKGNLVIKYQDVYGNEYHHYYGLSFWFVGLIDNKFISYLTYPTYSRKIKLAKKYKSNII